MSFRSTITAARKPILTRCVTSFGTGKGITDVVPSGVEGVTGGGPVHKAAIVELGVPLIDNCDLEAVGEYAAANKRWDFLLTMAPLAIGGGTGSPVNPIATF